MMAKVLKYQEVVIFYFSGTGNAKNAALWIDQMSKDRGFKSSVYNIDELSDNDIPEILEYTLVGICSPTHGFNLPPIVLKFLSKLPRVKNVDAFILNTRAGVKMHKLFLPGLSGMAQYMSAIWLRLKGYRVVGMQPLDLPSNWLLVHPSLRGKVVDSIYQRCNSKVNEFTNKLLDGKRVYKAFLSLPFDLLVIPIALLYYFIGRFFLAKTLFASYTCNKCGLCVEKCPVNAIKMVSERPFWTHKCESCMRCANICPQRSIETAQVFAFSMILLNSFIFTPLLVLGLEFLDVFDLIENSFVLNNIWTILSSYLFLMFLFANYWFMHFLLGFKIFNKILTYTSLSKFKFWRRYKAPKKFL